MIHNLYFLVTFTIFDPFCDGFRQSQIQIQIFILFVKQVRIVIFPKFSSVAAQQAVKLTISGAASDKTYRQHDAISNS